MEAKDVTKLLNLETIKDHILDTSNVAWDRHITPSSLDRWLKNFTGAALNDKVAEQTIAAWLLMNFTFYTSSEIQELCKVIYRKYIHKKLSEPYYLELEESTEHKIERILRRTLFFPLGNPSESGAFILYSFRTANSLPKSLFAYSIDLSEIISNKTLDDIVLIDDVTLSGSQATTYLRSLPLESVNSTLMTLFATPSAIDNLKKQAPYITPLYASLLDSRTNLFSDDSFVFSNADCKPLKELAYQLCYHYGNEIVLNYLPSTEEYMKKYPLGYADGQQMFGFFYNTPNNTLPIFWCDSPNWCPVFKRYNKVYNTKGVSIQNEQYW